MRPLDHHLVGLREALGGGEDRPGVAHRHVVAEELADPGHGRGEVDRAEDQHPRRRRERLHEHRQLVQPPLALRPVAPDAGQRPAASMPRASSSTASSRRSRAERAGRAVRARRRAGRPAARGRRRRWRPRPARAASTDAATSASSGNVVAADRLDEDVDDAAAGQPDGERVVVADAVPLQRRAARSSITSLASSYTAPSTQPPDTLPTTSPPATPPSPRPAARGALRKVRTTVASPNVAPRRATSAAILGEHVTHAGRVTLAPVPRARPGCARPRSRRRTAAPPPSRRSAARSRAALVRVDPHDPVGEPAQPGHLLAEQRPRRRAPSRREAITDDRAARHAALAAAVEELLAAPRRAGCRRSSRAWRADAAASAASGSRWRSSRVTRVSRVPSGEHLGAARRARDRRRARSAAARRRTGAIEPLTSTSSTTRRGRVRVRRCRSRADLAAARAASRARSGAGRAGPGAARREPPRARGAPPARRSSGDQPVHLGPLGGGQPGDVAVAQHLGRRWPSRGHGVGLAARLPPRAASGARPARTASTVGGPARRPGGPRRRSRRRSSGRSGQVVGAGAQREPAGPVDVVAVRRRRGGRARQSIAWTRSGSAAHRRPRAASGRTRPASRSTSARQRSATSPAHRRSAASAVPSDALGVLAVLQHRAERGGGAARGRARRAPSASSASVQSRVSATPGGLIRSGRAAAAAAPATWRPAARRLPGSRRAEDRDLALERRVLEPVVEAAALERVVHLAGAVGGDARRPAAVAARIVPSSGMVIVKSRSTSSRNASNSSSARSISSTSSTLGLRLERLQQRPGDQEPPVVELGLEPADVVDARRPRRPAGAAAGAGSPSRRAPGRRRGPRSTAAGSAARRAASASVLASSVLPTPASPSRNSGRPIRSARKPPWRAPRRPGRRAGRAAP